MIGIKRILITGASGYIGSRLCEYLSNQGYEIIGLFSSQPKDKRWSDIISEIIVGDIRDDETIKKISNSNAEVIIHLVSLNHHESEKSPQEVYKVNVQPTWDILHNSLKLNNQLKKFIYFSTIHVYGSDLKGIIEENKKATPLNAYALTHALSEEVCNYYNNTTKVECINIRLANSYGQPVFFDSKCWSLIINDLVKSAFENKKIILNSDGTAFRDFIHFSIICSVVDKIIKTTSSFQKNVINLCSSESISILDTAQLIKKVYKKKYGIDIPIYINSSELINSKTNHLNLTPYRFSKKYLNEEIIESTKSLSEGIEDLFNYFDKLNLNK